MVEPDFFLICTPCSEQEREFAVSILVEVKYTAVLSIDSVAMGSAIAMDVNITKSTAVAIFLYMLVPCGYNLYYHLFSILLTWQSVAFFAGFCFAE